MPFAIGGNQLDTGYEISNSLRFNDDDSPNVSNNPGGGSGSDGSRTQFSISMWVKRSRVSGTQQFLTSAVATNNFYGTIKFNGDNKIQINLINSGSDQDEIVTDAVYRDVSAWYHLFFVFDKTQASISNGVKLYVNGVLQTFGTTTYTQNQGYHFFRPGKTHYIGNFNGSEGYFDGYMSEIHFIDGSLKAHTDFGEFNDNGVWIPKKYDGSYGTYGFYLEFKQTGTSENSSGIGADTSGNDEHFAVSNLAATDVTTDTCTNNFCTMNPLDNYYAGQTFSEGNCKVVTGSSATTFNTSTTGVANGKWYWEVKIIDKATGSDQTSIGIQGGISPGTTDQMGYNTRGIQLRSNGNTHTNGGNATYMASLSDNDIVMVAFDRDNNNVYFGANGQWGDGSGNTDEANPTSAKSISVADDDFVFAALGDMTGSDTCTYEINFGNPSFSISSGNSDAEGHGNFEYAVPSGYFALCTKNLAEYG